MTMIMAAGIPKTRPNPSGNDLRPSCGGGANLICVMVVAGGGVSGEDGDPCKVDSGGTTSLEFPGTIIK
jgi:hypothetical protein